MIGLLKRFLPSPGILLLVAGLMLVSAAGSSWLTWRVVKGSEIRALNEYVRKMSDRARSYEETLAKLELQRQDAERNAARWQERWRNDQRDEDVRRWVTIPVPPAVRDRLRELPEFSGSSAQSPPVTHAAPRMPDGRDRRSRRVPCILFGCTHKM